MGNEILIVVCEIAFLVIGILRVVKPTTQVKNLSPEFTEDSQIFYIRYTGFIIALTAILLLVGELLKVFKVFAETSSASAVYFIVVVVAMVIIAFIGRGYILKRK